MAMALVAREKATFGVSEPWQEQSANRYQRLRRVLTGNVWEQAFAYEYGHQRAALGLAAQPRI